MRTPVTQRGLRKHDAMTPTQALITAWTEPGLHPWWHKKAQRAVRDAMPLVARALDDLVKEHGQ